MFSSECIKGVCDTETEKNWGKTPTEQNKCNVTTDILSCTQYLFQGFMIQDNWLK